jgi:hypothetical protein
MNPKVIKAIKVGKDFYIKSVEEKHETEPQILASRIIDLETQKVQLKRKFRQEMRELNSKQNFLYEKLTSTGAYQEFKFLNQPTQPVE